MDNNPLKEESKEAVLSEQALLDKEQKGSESGFRDDTAQVAKTRTITTTIRDTKWRFLFLATCCVVLTGSYFCYDNPAPVMKKIKQVLNLLILN
jgi:hypothetical protein